jgi:hypothetical protein
MTLIKDMRLRSYKVYQIFKKIEQKFNTLKRIKEFSLEVFFIKGVDKNATKIKQKFNKKNSLG